jgi:hypothetical protein
MVRFTDQSPAVWEPAALPGQDPATLPVGKFFGYGVDSRRGCFVDAAALDTLTEAQADELDLERLHPEFERRGKNSEWACVVVDPASGANLVAFCSGYGDGSYPSYWGLDSSGQPVCLVTDFLLLVEYLEGRATFPWVGWLGRALSHPDLSRIGLTVRVLPVDNPPHRQVRLELEGGSCKAVITNAGKEYSSDRLHYVVIRRIGTYSFQFDLPLQSDATLTVEYGLGVRAL